MKIDIKRLSEEAVIPKRGSEYAAGYDLYAVDDEDFSIEAHETKLVHTGIAMAIPEGYFGGVFARSGLSLKQGLRPANCVGVIDADYRGEIMVSLHNDTNERQTVKAHERIGQLVVMPFLSVTFEEKDELSDTIRGEGGFGSTGKL